MVTVVYLNTKIEGKALADGNIKDIRTAALLKYLSSCWRTLEISLINCDISLILTLTFLIWFLELVKQTFQQQIQNFMLYF